MPPGVGVLKDFGRVQGLASPSKVRRTYTVNVTSSAEQALPLAGGLCLQNVRHREWRESSRTGSHREKGGGRDEPRRESWSRGQTLLSSSSRDIRDMQRVL